MSSLEEEEDVGMMASSNNTLSNVTEFPHKISLVTKRYVLVFTEDIFRNVSMNYSYNISVESVVIRKIKRAVLALSAEDDAQQKSEEGKFVLLDLKDEGTWRPLLSVQRGNSSDFLVETILDNFDEWTLKHKDHDECEGCENEFTKIMSVLIIFGCSFMFVALLLGTAALIRNQLVKKKLSKGPYKVILTASDFVFPQLPDTRRVSFKLLHLPFFFNYNFFLITIKF